METQNIITVCGLVATTPRHIITAEGLAITSFRLASSVSSEITNWYTITGFGQTATNMASSISKGERVVLTGNLRIRDWDNGERSGTSVEVEVSAIGHDLTFGVSEFDRNVIVPSADQRSTPATPKKQTQPKHRCNCNNCGRNR